VTTGPDRSRAPLGAFCLVLHGHLPWVLHHGRWPHGEDWLFEAASETWLPLLEVLDTCGEEGLVPGWTIGLTPILLEQLAAPRFRTGLAQYLVERVDRARRDALQFEAWEDQRLAATAERWISRFTWMQAQFESMGRDIAGAMAAHARAGRIELLSSNATHAYHPLILHDDCARAQIRAGLAASQRHLGVQPPAVWLPECAYRPPGPWLPPALHGDVRWREGVGTLFESEGVRAFVVDTHLVKESRSEAIIEAGSVQKVGWDQAEWDHRRAWRSELEPYRIWEGDRALDLTVLARCPDVSEQVWSGIVGYPGDPRYLEFHKKHGPRGLRYWRVSGTPDLGGKEAYDPQQIPGAVAAHASHFVGVIRERLRGHFAGTGRSATVCAPFDAELFGHWWAEGPAFLLEVARLLARDPEIQPMALSERLAQHPADKAVSLPEGSWGAGGDHRVWSNDELRLYWEVVYRAEDRFLELWHRVPWRENTEIADLLKEAGRQLLLLQASDWPFVVSTRGAVDYGLRRIFEHAGLFDDLCNGVMDLLEVPDRPQDLAVAEAIARSKSHDGVFPDLDLAWWAPQEAPGRASPRSTG
jgi:1,4-alpha-glucan branching enzyme